MYRLTRGPCPECLQRSSASWTSDYRAGRQKDPTFRFSWRQAACYTAIRSALLEMSQFHCAFCDGPLGRESRETVDHFRPKSCFPELAYAWENLFTSCDMCQSSKREQFEELLLRPNSTSTPTAISCRPHRFCDDSSSARATARCVYPASSRSRITSAGGGGDQEALQLAGGG